MKHVCITMLGLVIGLTITTGTMARQQVATSQSIRWNDCLRQKPEWYGGAEAIRIAENLLLFQRAIGGWPKNIDMARVLSPAERAEQIDQKEQNDSTIDNGATRTQLIFLSRVFNATQQPQFKEAFLNGLDYLFKAQYENGGWPQYYPRLTGYYKHITFNDDAMIGVMNLLRQIARKDAAYSFVDDGRRRQAERAVDKGIECILRTQIKAGGRLTVWCAQHDEVTLQPAPARAYEKISLSGDESVGIVRFLMGVENPNRSVVEAIESAVAWFGRVKLTGIKLIVKRDPSLPNGFDRIVVEDANAPPLWARFYEIGADRPIFCGRDGVIKNALAEIEHERRTGYRWYVTSPAELLNRDYPEWRMKFVPTGASTTTVQTTSQSEPPLEWIEAETGHRVIRLSREPGTASLYFHQNPYTADGDKMVVTSPRGIATIHLKTGKIEQIVEGRASHFVVGRKTRQVFYFKDGTVFATHLDTRETRAIATLPDLRTGSGFAVNADETLLGGSFIEGGRQFIPTAARPAGADEYPGKGSMMEQRWAARLPMMLYTINIKSGELKTVHRATDWLNHVQFSPTDPGLMMFCHEGPWHKVDRIWTIRTDGSGLRKIHSRQMEMEIAGHEFFSADGKTIWYDLQTPKSKVFWLAGFELATGKQIRYPVERAEWSVHFNISPDGRLFAGDGGGPSSVAAPGNGQWIYLFLPGNGKLKTEKLVNLAKHNYQLEPNVTFTPDMKWIVFRSNLHGPTHVYAVEVK